MPAVKPVKLAVVPVPLCVAPPGVAVIVHVPNGGRPLSATEPVFTRQLGCVITPIIGAVGGIGVLTKTVFEFAETQPLFKLVTVKEYEFTGSPVNDVVAPTPFWVNTEAGDVP